MPPGEQLVIEGRLGGRVVAATWTNGYLVGDAVLVVAAKLVAASGVTVEQDGKVYTASLRTLEGASIALMRALDEIESVRISAPAEVPSTRILGGNPLSDDPLR
jgi:hypothetical protein